MKKPIAQLLFFFLILTATHHRLSSQHGPVISQDVGVLEEYTNPQVTSLYQDRRGLLWISTWGGMDRWDGHRMIHYPYIPFDSTSSPRDLRGFTCDDRNNIWYWGNGITRFDLETEIFHRIPLNFEGEKLGPRYLKHDPDGFLWVGAIEGIFKYFPEKDSLQAIPVLGGDEIVENWFRKVNILKDSTGNIWMSHNQYGLCWFDPDHNVFRKQPMDLPESVDVNMNVGSMKMDPEGNFWLFGRKAEMARFNPYTREFRWESLPVYSSVAPSSHGGLAIDHSGNIWYGTDRGLMRYDPLTKEITPMDTTSVLGYVSDMITDHHGHIIVGTFEGVKVINPWETEIRTIDVHLERFVEGVSWHSNAVRDGNFLWSGTFKAGLIRYNLETDEVVNYQADGRSGSINSNYVPETFRDRSGRIWFSAGWDGTMYRVNPDNNSFERFHMGESHMITQCKDGFFWILGIDRLVRFDPLSLDTMHILFKKPLPYEYLAGLLDMTPFIRDTEGIFWYGQQDNGLYRIDPERREWTHYNYDKNNPSGLPDQHVKIIYCDSRGTVWLSTWVGLSKVIKHPHNDTILSFDNHYITDLNASHTMKITEDGFGNIYVGTASGLLVVRPEGTVEKYTEKDGFPSNPSLIWMTDRDHENGDIYLGNQKMVIIPSSFLAPDTATVPIIFTEFRIGGETVTPGEESPLKSSILVADRIDLRHDQNFFRIDFAATYLSHPERNRYRYILEGIDEDTINSGNKSYAEYTDLKPGHYTFWVSSASHRGPWDPVGTSIDIRIAPPWYKSRIAIVLYFLLFLTLILGYIRLRTIRLQRDKHRLEAEVENRTEEIQQKNRQILELDTLKTRFFNNISHEFRTLVTMVKAPAETIMEEEKMSLKGRRGLEVIYRNATRLMNLVSQLLDISRIDKHSMKLALCEENLFDFAHSIAVSFASLAEASGIQYRYYLPRTDTLDWFDADKLEKIINNLLSNAFKFTDEGGKVRMDMVHKNLSNGMENVLEISITDTGKGIPEEEQQKIFDRFYQAEANLKKEGGGTGIGLALTHDLVELMHGSINLQSKLGAGSTFTVRIPIGKDHLEESEYSLTKIVKEKRITQTKIPQTKITEQVKIQTKAKEKRGAMEKPRVVVVEDNADILWLMAEKLGSEFDVMEAVDGSAGQKLATEHMPDLVITDLMMPRMDGYELCKKLKTDVRTSHIPVIMLTAKATQDDKIHGLETGADDYITKPFDIKEVLVRSRNLVEQRRKLRERFSNEITLDPREVVITSVDEKFLTKVMAIIDNHMGNEKFDVSSLCKAMNMSRSTLFRKLEALTNQTPVEFIRTIRLKRAASLLKQQFGNVSEVALEVGFSNPSYFSRVFRKAYFVTPAKFAKSYFQHNHHLMK
ncbi:MAG: ATP-binding protein [Bacteroidota bacterium]